MDEKQGLPGPNKHPERETFTGPPRWVKVSAIIAGALLVVVVAVMILSGGEHGPGRHGFGIGVPGDSSSITAASGPGHSLDFAGQA